MAAHALPEEQLLELLLTLKRTTPTEARGILNSQPQIAYALMAMMTSINAVKMEVVQDILSQYSSRTSATPAPPSATVLPPTIPSQTPPVIPPHMQTQTSARGATPTYPPQGAHAPQGYQSGPPGGPVRGYGASAPSQLPGFGPPHAPHQPIQPPGLPHAQPPYMPPPHAQQSPPAATPVLPEALTALPDDQKALIMRVIAMTREEVYLMPPADRENIIKLRTTLGLPT